MEKRWSTNVRRISKEWCGLKRLFQFKTHLFYILKIIMIKKRVLYKNVAIVGKWTCYFAMSTKFTYIVQTVREKYIRWKIYSFSKHVLNFKHFPHFSCRYKFFLLLRTYIFFSSFLTFPYYTPSFALFFSYISHIYAIFSYSMRNNIDFTHICKTML